MAARNGHVDDDDDGYDSYSDSDSLFDHPIIEGLEQGLSLRALEPRRKRQALQTKAKQVRSPYRLFWSLPSEVRNQIYAFCLIEPAQWDRQHEWDCRLVATPRRGGLGPPYLAGCDCRKRRGLVLLRTCRRIYQEAHAMFWTQNAFTWPNASRFTLELRLMNPQHRPLLRRISILSEQADYWARSTYQRDRLWDAVWLCTGLQVLEIRPDHLHGKPPFDDGLQLLQQIPRRLPSLKRLSFVHLMCYSTDVVRRLHFRTSYPVEFAGVVDLESYKGLIRHYQTNFLVHVRHAIETQVFSRASVAQGASFEMPADLTDRSRTTIALALRDQTTSDVQVRGALMSLETLAAHERQRKAAAQLRMYAVALRKKANLPTLQQEREQKAARQHRRQLVAVKRAVEEADAAALLEAKAKVREMQREEEREAKKREERQRKADQAMLEKELEDDRAKARKRCNRK